MGENTGTVTLTMEEKQAGLFARRIDERNTLQKQEEQLQKLLLEATTARIRAQGKCDGIAEFIAEEQGYDFTKVAQYDADTTKHTLIITFQAESAMEQSDTQNGAKVVPIKELKEEEEIHAD